MRDKTYAELAASLSATNRHLLKAAEEYAHAFNKAAYRLRGLDYATNRSEETRADVERMCAHFESQYVRMMEQGIDPAFAAKVLTDKWWNRLWEKRG